MPFKDPAKRRAYKRAWDRAHRTPRPKREKPEWDSTASDSLTAETLETRNPKPDETPTETPAFDLRFNRGGTHHDPPAPLAPKRTVLVIGGVKFPDPTRYIDRAANRTVAWVDRRERRAPAQAPPKPEEDDSPSEEPQTPTNPVSDVPTAPSEGESGIEGSDDQGEVGTEGDTDQGEVGDEGAP
jgi:hypothetical protein